ncbi:MAG: hypothetical protein WBK55_06235 [Alphaproteobacteria bacterium]
MQNQQNRPQNPAEKRQKDNADQNRKPQSPNERSDQDRSDRS